MKYLIFGTGDYYERYKDWFAKEDIAALLDNSPQKQNTKIDGIRVMAPEDGVKLSFARANSSQNAILTHPLSHRNFQDIVNHQPSRQQNQPLPLPLEVSNLAVGYRVGSEPGAALLLGMLVVMIFIRKFWCQRRQAKKS